MTRHPPQPLDAEERALAALLPRPHGRGEPGADMDARILAAAQDALHPQPAGRHPRRSWIGPTALAASLVLAVGLAWQLRPPPSLPAPAPAVTAAASANAEAAEMRAFEPPPPSPPPMARTLPRTAPPADTGVPAVSKQAARAADNVAAPPPAPPAPPAPAAPEVVGEAAPVATPQVAEPARVPAPVRTKAASEAMREGTAASGASAAENRDEAQRGADTATLGTTGAGEPEEDVPPATADSPEVREAWLRRIGELLAQGKAEEAKASLAEFRRRYPDAPLPPELRKLEP